MKENFLEVTAWGSFLLTMITPENISIIAGAASLVLSTTGILLNLIKIYKNTKNNEKTN